MKADSKLRYILAFSIGLFVPLVFAHDVPVHWAITYSAAASAIDDSPAYAGFLNMVSSDMPMPAATNAMIIGSGLEDNAVPPKDEGGYRSVNHFYDPLDTTYGKGLSDSPPDRREKVGLNSFVWGSTSNGMGYNFPGDFPPWNFGRNVNTSNIWSWPNARGYEWLGLTATNKVDRQANLDNMFRAVGQVMHLLEDTSQPQHVRNKIIFA